MQYTATTRQIRVTVEPIWLEDQSDPKENRFVWAYRVQIENLGDETVQLRSRHWMITDARGHVEHVRGPGVVGKQPKLEPGESFEYTSGAPLTTPSGFMGGNLPDDHHGGRVVRHRDPHIFARQPASAGCGELSDRWRVK